MTVSQAAHAFGNMEITVAYAVIMGIALLFAMLHMAPRVDYEIKSLSNKFKAWKASQK